MVERLKSAGEYPDDGPILTLAQLDPLNVEVLLPASEFGSIKPGMKARVSPEAPLEGSYAAVVKIVDRVVDASSGMFGVRLELPNPDHKLPGGLRCTVSFSGAGNPAAGAEGHSPQSRYRRYGRFRYGQKVAHPSYLRTCMVRFLALSASRTSISCRLNSVTLCMVFSQCPISGAVCRR